MLQARNEFRALLRLALPIILTNLGTMMLGTVDSMMVGNFDTDALAAAALGNVWVVGTLFLGMGIVYGIDPIVTQAHGAGDEERCQLALQRGIIIGVAMSVVIAVLWLFTEDFLLFAGQDPELSRAAHLYTIVQIPTIPFFLAFIAMRQYLQGRGRVVPALWVIAVANVFNVLFNWVLIYGKLGVAAYGLTGAGVATALTRLVMLIGLCIAFRTIKMHAGRRVPWSRRTFSMRRLLAVLYFGVPVGLQLMLEIWAFGASTLMAGLLTKVDVATHAIVLNIASMTFMIPLGVSFAAVTRVGNLIGAGRPHDAQRSAWVAFAMGGTFMAIAGASIFALRFVVPGFYTDDPDVLLLCATILPIAAAFQVSDGIQVVGGGVLRGMGRTVPAAWFNFVAYWVLALPLAWWMAFERGMGLRGVWWALAIGLAIVAVSLLLWVRSRGPAHLAARHSRVARIEPTSTAG